MIWKPEGFEPLFDSGFFSFSHAVKFFGSRTPFCDDIERLAGRHCGDFVVDCNQICFSASYRQNLDLPAVYVPDSEAANSQGLPATAADNAATARMRRTVICESSAQKYNKSAMRSVRAETEKIFRSYRTVSALKTQT